MNAASMSRPGWLTAPSPGLTAVQKYWLTRPGALTAGLRALGHTRLRVLAEYADGAPADEARALGIPPGAPVWIREIVMAVDGTDCVVARSLTPLAASHGVWQGLRRLRTRPLADLLYHDRNVRRGTFEVARLHRAQALHGVALTRLATAPAAARTPPARLLARRSVFTRMGATLLVEECFLPAFWRQCV